MTSELNQVERDFIEFMSQKTNRPIARTEELFRQTRRRFQFAGDDYSRLAGDIAHLFRMLCDTDTEEGMIDCYRMHALPNIFKYISYTYPKPRRSYLRDLIRDAKKGEWRNAWNFLRRKFARPKATKGLHLGPTGIAHVLMDSIQGDPVVVDYGSGPAYISYEIARANSRAAIFLVDVDSLVLEFALFRLRKTGAAVHAIPVTKTNLYPQLPEHNICIASEVMEHLAHPLRACDNIIRALRPDGILYGRFDDHQPNMYHVSPDLAELRRQIARSFQQIGQACYRKKSEVDNG